MVDGSGQLAERVQLGRARARRTAGPRPATRSPATQLSVAVRRPETDGPLQARQLGQQVPDARARLRVDRHDEEDRRPGQRAQHRLRDRVPVRFRHRRPSSRFGFAVRRNLSRFAPSIRCLSDRCGACSVIFAATRTGVGAEPGKIGVRRQPGAFACSVHDLRTDGVITIDLGIFMSITAWVGCLVTAGGTPISPAEQEYLFLGAPDAGALVRRAHPARLLRDRVPGAGAVRRVALPAHRRRRSTARSPGAGRR